MSFILFLSGSVSASGDDKRLEFSVKETNYSGWMALRLELKNLTDDTLVFLTDNCDHNGLYGIDGEGATIETAACYLLAYEFIALAPHSTYQETKYVKISSLKKDESFRVRINLAEPKERHDPKIASKEKDIKKEALYSNYIQVK